jgi:hypothetical protein
MRTTLTLEPDVAEKLRLRMASEKTTLKRAVNDALRTGLKASPAKPRVKFKVKPHAFNFRPGIDLNKMNQLVDELEVEDYLRRNPR